MAANTDPIYSRAPDIQWSGTIATAVTAVDGSGATTVFTADATNGGIVSRLKIRALGTNIATVMRFFVNNGSSIATPANNSLIGEITVAATTLSQTSALADNEVPLLMPLPLPLGYRITATIGTTIAAGLQATAFAGKY